MPVFISYTEKNVLNRLHFGYKNGISLTKLEFRLQKLRFAYKYLYINLQSCVFFYKMASCLSSDLLCLPCDYIIHEKVYVVNTILMI